MKDQLFMKKIFFFTYMLLLLLSLHHVVAQQDVLGIGQALYDVFIECDEKELHKYLTLIGTTKGNSVPISGDTAQTLFKTIQAPLKSFAGGATSNTITGIADLGGKAGFIGTVGDDIAGKRFKQDMKKSNIAIKNMIKKMDGAQTGIVFSFIPADGERTMGAWLGTSPLICLETITPELMRDYKVILSDVYMLYNPLSAQALHKSFAIAQSCGLEIALNLASIFAVDTHRAEIYSLLPCVHILFGNEDEMKMLYQTESLDQVIMILQNSIPIGIITRDEKGAIIVTRENIFDVPAKENIPVIDTTGAGDLFAAGFLYGYTHGMDLVKAAQLGHECAAVIIQQVGAHAEKSLQYLIQAVLASSTW